MALSPWQRDRDILASHALFSLPELGARVLPDAVAVLRRCVTTQQEKAGGFVARTQRGFLVTTISTSAVANRTLREHRLDAAPAAIIPTGVQISATLCVSKMRI
jgi:hypothetical protein